MQEVIPTQFVFFSMSAIVGSAVLYQEFRDMTLSNVVNFGFGVGHSAFQTRILPASLTGR